MLETLDYTIRIGGTPTFLYFDFIDILYLYSAYAAHFVYFNIFSPQLTFGTRSYFLQESRRDDGYGKHDQLGNKA